MLDKVTNGANSVDAVTEVRNCIDLLSQHFTNALADGNDELVKLIITEEQKLLDIMVTKVRDGENTELDKFVTEKTMRGTEHLNECMSTACKNGRKEIVNLMITNGANGWDDGLYNACSGSNFELVELMLTKGAGSKMLSDIFANISTRFGTDSSNKTRDEIDSKIIDKIIWHEHRYNSSAGKPRLIGFFRVACRNNNIKLIELLITNNAYFWNEGLEQACYGGHPEVVNFMVKKGANDWNMGLRAACSGGHMDMIIAMTAKGANDWNGGLEQACRGGHSKIVNFMMNLGADTWDDGFFIACRGGHAAVCELLISKSDYKVNVFNKAMLEACKTGFYGAIDLMVKNGAYDFATGLDHACINNLPKIAEMMINYGVTVSSLNYGLKTSCKYGHMQIAELMVENGADVFGEALMIAHANRHTNLQELMSTYKNKKNNKRKKNT